MPYILRGTRANIIEAVGGHALFDAVDPNAGSDLLELDYNRSTFLGTTRESYDFITEWQRKAAKLAPKYVQGDMFGRNDNLVFADPYLILYPTDENAHKRQEDGETPYDKCIINDIRKITFGYLDNTGVSSSVGITYDAAHLDRWIVSVAKKITAPFNTREVSYVTSFKADADPSTQPYYFNGIKDRSKEYKLNPFETEQADDLAIDINYPLISTYITLITNGATISPNADIIELFCINHSVVPVGLQDEDPVIKSDKLYVKIQGNQLHYTIKSTASNKLIEATIELNEINCNLDHLKTIDQLAPFLPEILDKVAKNGHITQTADYTDLLEKLQEDDVLLAALNNPALRIVKDQTIKLGPKQLLSCLDSSSTLYQVLVRRHDIDAYARTYTLFDLWGIGESFAKIKDDSNFMNKFIVDGSVDSMTFLKDALSDKKKFEIIHFMTRNSENYKRLFYALQAKNNDKVWSQLYALSQSQGDKIDNPLVHATICHMIIQNPTLDLGVIKKNIKFIASLADLSSCINPAKLAEQLLDRMTDTNKNYAELLASSVSVAGDSHEANVKPKREKLTVIFNYILTEVSEADKPRLMIAAHQAIDTNNTKIMQEALNLRSDKTLSYPLLEEGVRTSNLFAELNVSITAQQVLTPSVKAKVINKVVRLVEEQCALMNQHLARNVKPQQAPVASEVPVAPIDLIEQKWAEVKPAEKEYRAAVYKAVTKYTDSYGTVKAFDTLENELKAAESKLLLKTDKDQKPVVRIAAMIITNLLTLFLTAGISNLVHLKRTGDFLFHGSTNSSEKVKRATIKTLDEIEQFNEEENENSRAPFNP